MSTSGQLVRRLGVGDAVIVGLGAMVGAGVFVAFAPAARAAGAGMLLGLVLAASVAYCNATSSARLAAMYPASGGTYVYGRERLGDFWGYLAGWGFVIGKTASCAAMALTVGYYVAPGSERLVAVGAVAALTTLNCFGIRKSAIVSRVIVGSVLTVLVLIVIAGWSDGSPQAANLTQLSGLRIYGVLQAAGFLFFAFAGYARIATLGEEVREPDRTIPLAIPIALGITVVAYFAVAVTVLAVLGAPMTAMATAPLVSVVRATSWSWLAPVVRVAAALAALGSLLALLLGVSRTTLAMARDRRLPGVLDAVHPRYGVPHRAETAIGAVVVAIVLTSDVRGAIGFSSFAVLAYYAIANASALTLDRTKGSRLIPLLGLAGCLMIAGSLPLTSLLAGAATLAAGAGSWVIQNVARRPRRNKRRDC